MLKKILTVLFAVVVGSISLTVMVLAWLRYLSRVRKYSGQFAVLYGRDAGQIYRREALGSSPRLANGIKSRVDRLKAIGNGQVPRVAELAWRILSEAL